MAGWRAFLSQLAAVSHFPILLNFLLLLHLSDPALSSRPQEENSRSTCESFSLFSLSFFFCECVLFAICFHFVFPGLLPAFSDFPPLSLLNTNQLLLLFILCS